MTFRRAGFARGISCFLEAEEKADPLLRSVHRERDDKQYFFRRL